MQTPEASHNKHPVDPLPVVVPEGAGANSTSSRGGQPQSRARRFGRLRGALFALAMAIVLVVGIGAVRTASYGSVQPAVESARPAPIPEGAAERLAAAVRIPTISHEDPTAFDGEAFRELHRHLTTAFPKVHSQLRRETVATHSLLYTWQGSDPSLKPLLLMGHLDVVPVEPGTKDKWKVDPFSGQIADGFIWGRGAIDNKSAVVGILEAVEMLLTEGFRPTRSVLIAFGHDEEVGGTGGAREIAARLKKRGIQLEFVMDEGGVIGEGLLPGIPGPVAMIGIAEKGFLSIELSATMDGGHSSLPPRQSTVGIVSAAVARLEANPMPARLEAPTRQLFGRIGPSAPLGQRAAFANLWLTRPMVMKTLESKPSTNAMVRTTMAATIFQAGEKDNVLPSRARAVVNFRILPGDSIAGVLEHVRRVVADPRVEVKAAGRFSAEPSSVSSTESPSFQQLERTIRSTTPNAVVAPYQVVVVTDSRYFGDLSTNVFRFLPIRLTSGDLARMHGIDERISVHDYEQAIRIYRQLLLTSS
jgi:carboxypeptidase PM20D1